MYTHKHTHYEGGEMTRERKWKRERREKGGETSMSFVF